MLSKHDRTLESRTPFAIRLIQADGAIIRNNEIRVVDPAGFGTLPAAIQLQSNRAMCWLRATASAGCRTPVHADAKSSHRDVGNHLEVCPPGATRFLAPDESSGAGELQAPACRQVSGP